MNTNWFSSRGLRVLGYQQNAIAQITEHLDTTGKAVLAACPSAGKTLMSIYLLDEYLKKKPDHKVLILAHGTTVLRSQYFEALSDAKPDFTSNLVEKASDYDPNASVNVCLPQTINKAKLSKVDLLIVDEAHQFYYADMVRRILRRCRPKKQLLLTGTPSKFVRRSIPIVPVSVNTIYDEGMVSDLFVEVAQSSYDFNDRDYNRDGDLLTKTYIRNKDTETTLEDLLTKLHYRLKRKPKEWDINKLAPKWSALPGKLKKTMIACKSQNQARAVKKYFESKGVTCALSISDDDVDSTEITHFKEEEECLVLIVVGRGILGFNYPELENVIDMTMSKNIDRIFQLMSRVIRIHPDGKRKLFVKVAPHDRSDEFRYIMTATLMMTDDEFFTLYNGKNFLSMPVVVRNTSRVRSDKTRRRPEDMTPKQRQRHIRPVEFEGLPVFDFFQNILHNDTGDLEFYAKTSMGIVRSMFTDKNPKGHWDIVENCIEEARKHNSPSEWERASKGSYQAALRNGWLDECTAHMTDIRKPKGYWDIVANCIEAAKPFNSPGEWKRASWGSYNAARRNGWLDECTAHMTGGKKPNGHWDIVANCIEAAKPFNSPGEWKRESQSSYNAAQRNGWIDECTAHMTGGYKPRGYWTKERCIEEARKHNSLSEWKRASSSSYAAAWKNGWLEECKKHLGTAAKQHGSRRAA